MVHLTPTDDDYGFNANTLTFALFTDAGTKISSLTNLLLSHHTQSRYALRCGLHSMYWMKKVHCITAGLGDSTFSDQRP